MNAARGWIGVDLDGTLAFYDGWHGVEHIGAPIAPMLVRVKGWLAEGKEVRIFTARVATRDEAELATVRARIDEWCHEYIGQSLEVTNVKDYAMVQLWDDRAVHVLPNLGITGEEFQRAAADALGRPADAVDILREIIDASDGCLGHRGCLHSMNPWKKARALVYPPEGMREHRWIPGPCGEVCANCSRHREDEGIRGCSAPR